MVLVDKSIWIDHFQKGNSNLKKLLYDSEVVIHPYITGELACGNLSNRREILSLLESLPKTYVISQEEILEFITINRLYGQGVGIVDIHLIASSLLDSLKIWSMDKSLIRVAEHFNIVYHPADQRINK